MKKDFIKLSFMATVLFAVFSLSSCGSDDDSEYNDDNAAAVASQFVDYTVMPTYSELAAKAELLAAQLQALKNNPNQNDLNIACETFLAAREQWEKSEAFLFGAAGDYGVDPHIDSWPLDEDAFNTLMNSPAMIAALDGDDGDVVAGERLGNALLGFHGIEYILFAEGHAKSVAEITDNEWIYVVAVAGDLRNRCYQLEAGWLGDDAPSAHIAKLEELEMPYDVAGSGNSYGYNMKHAGQAGSTYGTRIAALMAILQGCVDIADEVGSSKIYAAWHGDEVTYIESPYSYMSIDDFTNNIRSIQNVWLGGVEGQRNSGKSMQRYVKDIDAAVAANIDAKIENALAKIQAMPAPFVLNYSSPANGEAVQACAELSEALDDAIETVRNN